MNVSSAGSTNPLLKQLQTNGLSADKAKLVQSDLTVAEKTRSGGTAAAGISPSARAAFDTKIAADVSSGKLSASDAVAVGKTMDELSGGLTASATASRGSSSTVGGSAGAPRPAGGGGGGGSGDSSKTELSELVTISGSTMTTVITYTDGTTSTTTATATGADQAKYDTGGSDLTSSGASKEYSPSIEKGSLVDQIA